MTRILLLLLLLPALRLLAQQPDPRLLNLEGLVNVTSAPAIPDARLYAAFDSAYLETLRRDNPTLLLRWNYYLDNAFIISDFPLQKGDITQYPAVQIPDVFNFNILVLEKNQHLKRDWQRPAFYRVNNTNQVLMYFSGKEFNRKFREWVASTPPPTGGETRQSP